MTDTVDVRRRRLLVALAAVPLLGSSLTGCSGAGEPKTAPGPRTDVDVDVKVRWRAIQGERVLLALHEATVAAHPGLAGTLDPMAAHHDEHLAVIEADGPVPFSVRSGPDGSAGPTDRRVPRPDVPADPEAALAELADAEAAAREARVEDCLAAGPRLAAVLASVAACEDGHRIALGSR